MVYKKRKITVTRRKAVGKSISRVSKRKKNIPPTITQPSINWRKKTLNGLVEECHLKGINTTATKEDLIKRLENYEKNETIKMPLGKLSRLQVSQGLDLLLSIEEALKKKRPLRELQSLSSNFYTLIPHNFGRRRPEVIKDFTTVQNLRLKFTCA